MVIPAPFAWLLVNTRNIDMKLTIAVPIPTNPIPPGAKPTIKKPKSFVPHL
jgi:hypothetical protein